MSMLKTGFWYQLIKNVNVSTPDIIVKIGTHGFSLYIKNILLENYKFNCTVNNCYACLNDVIDLKYGLCF